MDIKIFRNFKIEKKLGKKVNKPIAVSMEGRLPVSFPDWRKMVNGKPLGKIPPHAIPFWKKLPKNSKIKKSQKPKPPPGCKPEILYYENTSLKPHLYAPRYIIIPSDRRMKKIKISEIQIC